MGIRLTSSRQPGQGGAADHEVRDLRAELLKAEAAHYAKTKGISTTAEVSSESTTPAKRQLQDGNGNDDDGEVEEDPEAKRRRILEETRDIDADSDGAASSSEDDRCGS